MLIPLLRDVRAGEDADTWPTLARCTWCKQRCVVRTAAADEFVARRAAALAFVARGSRPAAVGSARPATPPVDLVEMLPPVIEG